MRKISVKYDGTCTKCGNALVVGSEVMYGKTTGIFCLGCEPTDIEEIRTYRQNRLDRRNDRRKTWAASARQKITAIDKSLKPYNDWAFITQPVLVGHHSEGRHRNLLKRIHNKMDKSHELWEKAKKHEELSNQTAVVKGDAAARWEAVRLHVLSWLKVGDVVDCGYAAPVTVLKINKKTANIKTQFGKGIRELIYFTSLRREGKNEITEN